MAFKVSTHPRVSLIEHVKSLLLNVLRKIQSHCLSEDDVDWMYFQVDRAYHLMVRGSSLYSIPDTLLARIQEVRQVVGELNKDTYSGYVSGKVLSGNRGRPKFIVTKEQLEFMLDYRFTIPQISRMLKVSASTIARRLHEYGLSTSVLFTRMSDQDLDSIIQEISSEFINCGYKRMQGFLAAKGLQVQQRRVRCSMRRIDPEGVLASMLIGV